MASRRTGSIARGERSQGLDEGAELLNRYLDMMKEFATEDVRDIPNGVYSVKKGMANGVYVMLKMPEEASGEVFWRFHPLGNVAQPLTSPNDIPWNVSPAPVFTDYWHCSTERSLRKSQIGS